MYIWFPLYLPYSFCLTLNSPLDLKISQNGCLCCFAWRTGDTSAYSSLVLSLFRTLLDLLLRCSASSGLSFVNVYRKKSLKRFPATFLSRFQVVFIYFLLCLFQLPLALYSIWYTHTYISVINTGSVYRSVRLMVLVSLGKLVEFLFAAFLVAL